MTTKFYIDSDGKYIGGFDGALPPKGAIEVPFPPEDARQIWSDEGWGEIPPPEEETAIEKLVAFLAANPDVAELLG